VSASRATSGSAANRDPRQRGKETNARRFRPAGVRASCRGSDRGASPSTRISHQRSAATPHLPGPAALHSAGLLDGLHESACGVLGSLARLHDLAEAPAPAEDLVAHLLLAPHPGTDDVVPAFGLQGLESLGLDHPPVGDQADAADVEARPEPLGHWHERRDVARVAGPQLARDRPALLVEHHAHDHLLQVWPVILAVTAPAEALATLTLEVDRGRVEEDELERGEEVPVPREEDLQTPFFVELVEPAQGGEHPLAASAFLPAVLDDLEVGVALDRLLSEEHWRLRLTPRQ